jgi:pilus assembly protein FimV
MYKRPLRNVILALCGCAAALHTLALGFGRIPESIAFGQALDLMVPLRLEPGENLSPACLRAEVSVGEQRLPAAAVQAVLERAADDPERARVRIRSAVVVLEPLVAVNLSVGCSGPVSRQFTLFADPPGSTATVAQPLALDTVRPLVGETMQPRVEAATPSAGRTATKSTKASKKALRTARAEAPRKRPVDRAGAALAATPRMERASPRLMLEEPEALLRAAALAVATQDAALATATQAASTAQLAAAAAEQRLAALEQNLNDMRAQAITHQALMEQVRSRLSQAEDQGRLMWGLTAVVLTLASLALWLGIRLRTLQRERQAGWWQGEPTPSMPGPPAVVADADTAPSSLPAVPRVTSLQQELAEAPHAAVPALAFRSAALSPQAMAQESLTRAVSVDELIDLEQQAEFFVVLGEEDAAIDLLMDHLRSSGGISPLPYLKLLEIYRRRQDREAYERMRKRFNLRFNGVAPLWDADPEHGRDLQAYPEVLSTLQAAWPSPLDAMAELENLLFRKRSGELFELPAYRDVLTLYSVARDLHRQADRDTADVDVLLPLLHGQDMAATAAQSIFDRMDPRDASGDMFVEDRPTAPVDLDLSELSDAVDSRSADLSPVSATLRRSY